MASEPSRVFGWTVLLVPDDRAGDHCTRCGFSTVLTIPVYLLTGHGVTSMAPCVVCVRCHEDRRRGR